MTRHARARPLRRRTAAGPLRRLLLLPGVRAPAAAFARTSRACRHERDWAGAAAVIEVGRRQHPDDRSLMLEAARVALHQHRHAGEDAQFRWIARLRELQRAIEAAPEAASDVECAAVLGEVALALRDRDAAVAHWETVAATDPQQAPTAHLKQAQALRQADELTAARAALARVEGELTGQRAYRSEVRRVASRLSRWASDETVAALLLRLDVGDTDEVAPLLAAAMTLRGYGEAQVAAVRPVLDDVVSLAEQAGHGAAERRDQAPLPTEAAPDGASAIEDGAPTPEDGARSVVLVSGFLYSGSGAVLDYLRERDCFHLPFGTKETGFLKKPDHLGLLLEDDHRHVDGWPQGVARTVLASVFGFGQTGTPLYRFLDQQRDARWFVPLLRRLLAELDRAGRDAAVQGSATVPRPQVQECLRRFCDGLVTHLTPATRTALLDNPIIAHDLERTLVFSRGKAVAVFRDPRDQYVSQRYESPRALGCADFIDMMQERLDRFRHLSADPQVAERVAGVRFEDFVRQESTRRALLAWLGHAHGCEVQAGRFDPATSARNIGIHEHYSDQHEIAQVQRALGPGYANLEGL